MARLDRRPGQKEERYRHLLGVDNETLEGTQPSAPADISTERTPPTASPELETRVAVLEAEVVRLRDVLDVLAADGPRPQPTDP